MASRERHYRSREREDKSSKMSRKTKEKLKKKKKSRKDDGESSGSDEMNLDKELHPIGWYIEDRAEMLRQVFKVIRGSKLRAMMTSQLRDLDLDTLKALCLQQLEGMSRKRINYILAGKEMDESSETDEDGSDSECAELDDDFFRDNRDGSFNRSSHSENGEEEILTKRKKKKKHTKKKKHDDSTDLILSMAPSIIKPESGKNMELLELEMRARAIKSLLNVEKPETDQPDNLDPEPKPEEKTEDELKAEKEAESKEKEVLAEAEIERRKKEVEDKEAMRKAAEEEKRLQKARLALMSSEARKREEEEALERKHAEIRKKFEEQQKKIAAEEEAARKKAEAEADKARKKAEKEADYQKFLKWKEEKLKKEIEQDTAKAKTNLKRKEQAMRDDELRRKYEREQMIKTTELKKRRIERETVVDNLDKAGYISRKDKSDGGATTSSKHALDKRRYRKKGADEEGEYSDGSLSYYSDRSRSFSRSRSRSRSRHHSGSRRHSRTGSRQSSRSKSRRSDSGTPTLSESEEDDKKFDSIREDRLKRVKEIRERKRKQKPGSDIEDGEVDSEGEFFVPSKEKNKAIEDKQKVDSEPKKKVDKKSEKTKIKESPKKVLEVSKMKENVEIAKKKGDKEKTDKVDATENVKIEDNAVASVKKTEIRENETIENNESEKAKNIETVDQKPVEERQVVETERNINTDNSIQSVEDSLKRVEESIKETEDSIKKTEDSIKRVNIEPPKLLEFLPPIQRLTAELPVVEPSDYTFSIRSREDTLALESAPLQYPEETDEEWHQRTAEERKRLDKMEKLRQTRIRRMQAFQARTDIQEETHEEESADEDIPEPEMEDDDNMETEDEETKEVKSKKAPEDFYKSFYEEQTKLEKDTKVNEKEEISATTQEAVIEPQPEVDPTPIAPEMDEKKSKNKRKGKSAEEKVMEGVGYWTRMCESQGDFETPEAHASREQDTTSLQKVEELLPKTEKEMPESPVKDSKVKGKSPSKFSSTTLTRKGLARPSKFHALKKGMSGSSFNANKKNKDNPTKQEVDADQEMDNVTWADRWFQNSKVQKVVKDSKMLSKVRTSIKVKLNKPVVDLNLATGDDSGGNPSTSNKTEAGGSTDESLPNVIGSMEEYAKIVGKSVKAIQDERVNPALDGSSASEEEEDEEEDDGLWGAILGGKEET